MRYNEAVRLHKAGLEDEAEHKFRRALTQNKRHVSSLPAPAPILPIPALTAMHTLRILSRQPFDVRDRMFII